MYDKYPHSNIRHGSSQELLGGADLLAKCEAREAVAAWSHGLKIEDPSPPENFGGVRTPVDPCLSNIHLNVQVSVLMQLCHHS